MLIKNIQTDPLVKKVIVEFTLLRIFIVGAFLLLTGCASLTPKQSSKIEPGGDINKANLNSSNFRIAIDFLHQDIDQLVTQLIEIHPEPFALISEQDFMREVWVIKKSIRYPLTRNEFFVRIAPLISQLGDIHSRLDLPRSLLDTSAKVNNKLFPLAVLYEKSGLYVAADLSSNPKIPAGALITEINHAPAEFLLHLMRRLTAKETDAGHRRKIQIDFPWLLSVLGYAKPVYDISYFWQGREVSVQIDGIAPPNVTSETNLVIDDSDEQSQLLINDSGSTASYYGYSKLNATTGLLWFNDFNEEPQVFSSFLADKFEQLAERGINNLILDVRYNDGGLSQNIKSLLAYLTNKPVYWASKGEINISRQLKKLHHIKTKQRRKNKFKWGLQWLPLEWTNSLRYEISWGDLGEKVTVDFEAVEPAEAVIPQNITVLTNGFCYSACSSFVATINRYGLGKTLGEKTGSYVKVQYAYPLTAKLKHTQLALVLPTMKLSFDSKVVDRQAVIQENNSLISPQKPIVRSLEQIINRQDIVLSEALKALE